MNGADVLLLASDDDGATYDVVGSQRDVTFNETNEEIDFSSKDAREYKGEAGRYSSTVSLDSLYVPSDTAYQTIKAAVRSGDTLKIQRQEDDAAVEAADCFVTSCSEAAPDQGPATVSVDLRITGTWA